MILRNLHWEMHSMTHSVTHFMTARRFKMTLLVIAGAGILSGAYRAAKIFAPLDVQAQNKPG
jgi:hypothetical protein